jgi:MscS family membrane protein
MEHAERLNLRILEEFEKAGIEFAFPTQTLFLAGDPKRRLAVEMLNKGLEQPG